MAITITLNGVEVSGHPGMTILELAREAGVEIPTLCHDPHLKPYGACRVCIVEDERNGALLASCVAPIAPGMVINTQSPKVLESRRTIVKLMLASHPDSCMVCDKGNRCHLRQIASDLGIGLTGFHRIPHPSPIMDLNPFIERDLSKCILCAKCIRADHELVVEGAIDYFNRGFPSKPATVGDGPLESSECTFCGTCMSICPTAAISEKLKPYRGTTSKVVRTVCGFCGCGCNLNLEVSGDRVTRASPAGERSPNGITLCVRGSSGWDYIHSKERLSQPLLRIENELQPVSWEEAIDAVAKGLEQAKSAHGPDSLAVLGCSKCTNEENYLLQKFARVVLGTNNIDNGGRLYNAATLIGLREVLGFPASTNPIDDIEQSNTILVIGADPEVSAPVLSYAIKRAVRHGAAKLILINPWRTKLAPFAHLQLQPKSGTDGVVVSGIIRTIVDEHLFDESSTSLNLEALKSTLDTYTPQFVEMTSGVPNHEIATAARLFAEANAASIIFGTGITQQNNGTQTVAALANLALLTGNLGRVGAGIYPLQMENNALGASDMGCLPDFLPGYENVANAEARKKLGDAWGTRLPDSTGLTAPEMIQQAHSGRIKSMYIVGENPVACFPNPAFVQEALSSLDFLVVQDLFLTETAKLASVVLPAASFAEKEGTFTNFERRVQRVRQAITPFASSLPDWEIIQRLSNIMGYRIQYSSPQDIMLEIAETVPLYNGMKYEDIPDGGAFWPKMNGSRFGTDRLYETGFPEGSGRFVPIMYEPPEEEALDGYSFDLLAGRNLCRFGSGVRSSKSARLSRMFPEPYVEINPVDADEIGIDPGSRVKIISPAGFLVATAKINRSISKGTLVAPVAFAGNPVNALFDMVFDPRSKTPLAKSCKVKLEKIE